MAAKYTGALQGNHSWNVWLGRASDNYYGSYIQALSEVFDHQLFSIYLGPIRCIKLCILSVESLY